MTTEVLHTQPMTEIRPMALDAITQRIEARSIKTAGVERLKGKIERLGFQVDKPIRVYPHNGGYCLIDGNHRLEAARALNLETVYAVIVDPPASDLDAIKQARESNEASETVVPTTFVDDAELVWRLTAEHTQAEAARALGWERGQVAKYAMLQKIAPAAWNVVRIDSVPTIQGNGTSEENGDGTTFVPSGTFTEGLLRNILPLRRKQQVELCKGLAGNKITKDKLKKQAEKYRARNEMARWALGQLSDVERKLIGGAVREIYSGRYDGQWKTPEKKSGKGESEADTPAGPQDALVRLVTAIRDQWQRKHSITLHHGDFYQGVKKIPDASVDAIITDPPYNISTQRVYRLANQADWNKDFGEWDNQDEAEFIANIQTWAAEFYRVLKPSKSGFMFVGEAYINIAQSIFDAAGFDIKGTFFWCRANPGVSVSKADFMPAMDFAIQFVKPGDEARTFVYPGEPDGFSWFKSPICGGNERLKDAAGNTLHPTQKPEAVIRHLMELITHPGDMVMDAFMGVGTTAAVAKAANRKFVGFEMDDAYFAAAKARVEVRS
jgi:DNA modification methylase